MSDLLTYKLLDAVARYGSIRRAAEKSAITPSALNRRILNSKRTTARRCSSALSRPFTYWEQGRLRGDRMPCSCKDC